MLHFKKLLGKSTEQVNIYYFIFIKVQLITNDNNFQGSK